MIVLGDFHCVKNVHIPSYSGPHFPAFRLNTERYSVYLRIQSECGKTRTGITQNMDTFHAAFNSKSKSWSVNDTTTEEGTILEHLTSFYGMKQLISAPTHILQHSSSCIDLIFVNQPNQPGIHPSLHQNCHNQVIFCKLKLKIEYP